MHDPEDLGKTAHFCARRWITLFTGKHPREEAKDMDELIRTLAAFGRPFPPELREIYRQVEKDYPERPRGPGQLANSSADAAEGEPFERDSGLELGRQPRRQLIRTP
jgi:hypothetical protein